MPNTTENDHLTLAGGSRLSDAVLIHFEANNCHFENADFSRAYFRGETHFNTTHFEKFVNFEKAKIDHLFADLSTFANGARFHMTRFNGWASFEGTYFGERTEFNATEFCGVVLFRGNEWAMLPENNSMLLACAAHLNLAHESEKIWPKGWRVITTEGHPNLGGLEIESEVSESEPAS